MSTIGELKLLRKFLNQLGLDQEEQHVYTTLVEHGTSTVLQLARLSGINRTTTYRVLERLEKVGIVEVVIDEHKRLYRISGANSLAQAIKIREAEVKLLRDLYPTVAPLVQAVSENQQPGTKVLFYRGIEGVKQMIWNVLRAKKEAVGYTHRPIESVAGEEYAREWSDEWVRRGLIFRDIITDTYLEFRKKEVINFDEKHFPSRFVPASVLNITHQMDIYNNVVAYYNWHEGEVFGVEIYNEKIAMMHKQLFEIVWKMGKKRIL